MKSGAMKIRRAFLFVSTIFMVLSFVFSHSVFHTPQVICFSVLFARLCLSTPGKDFIFTTSDRRRICFGLVLDYILWSSSRFWLPSITDITLSDPLSSPQIICCKLLSIFAFTFLCLAGVEEKQSTPLTIPTQADNKTTSKQTITHNLFYYVNVMYVFYVL